MLPWSADAKYNASLPFLNTCPCKASNVSMDVRCSLLIPTSMHSNRIYSSLDMLAMYERNLRMYSESDYVCLLLQTLVQTVQHFQRPKMVQWIAAKPSLACFAYSPVMKTSSFPLELSLNTHVWMAFGTLERLYQIAEVCFWNLRMHHNDIIVYHE